MFHLKDGLYIGREGEAILLRKTDTAIEGAPVQFETRMTIEEFSSMVSTCSPFNEQYGSWNYIVQFLRGNMRCAGCGKKLHKFQEIVPLCEPGPVCLSCFERWKPNFR